MEKWKFRKRKEKRKYESLKDHNSDEILVQNGQNIELYTIWDFESKKWLKRKKLNLSKKWKKKIIF